MRNLEGDLLLIKHRANINKGHSPHPSPKTKNGTRKRWFAIMSKVNSLVFECFEGVEYHTFDQTKKL